TLGAGIRLEGGPRPAVIIVLKRLILDQRATTGLYRLDMPKCDQVINSPAALAEIVNSAIDRDENRVAHAAFLRLEMWVCLSALQCASKANIISRRGSRRVS